MTIPQTVIKGSIVTQGVPEEACFETFPQLLASLETYLGVEIAASSISNVIISNVQPGSADKDKLWVRRANSGAFVGLYMYSGTQWIQVLPAPQQITILYGDSSNPPAGYALLPNDGTILTSAEYADMIAKYGVLEAGVGPNYVVYPAIFTG